MDSFLVINFAIAASFLLAMTVILSLKNKKWDAPQ